jgi:small subunit ribosomal protein S16
VAVRIRLLRMGKIRNPQYRIVVADSRTKRDGRAIEYVGLYHPREEPSRIEVNSERVQHWLSVGAQPSEPVIAILSKTGDWQKFKGLPPPAEPLRVAPARVDRTAAYEAQARAAAGLAEAETKARREAAPARPAKAAKATAPAPETTAPVATAPETTAPVATAPDAAAPDAAAPDATATGVEPAEAASVEPAPAEAASEESSGAGADAQA